MSRKDPEARIREPWTVDMFCPTCGHQFRANALGDWTCPACGAMSWGRKKRRDLFGRVIGFVVPIVIALAVATVVWVLFRSCGSP